LNEAHKRLMRGARGGSKQPGEIRRSQNWIRGSRPGNAVYVPRPSEKLAQLLSSFEKYIHANNPLPKLVRAGLLHAQFETIHPYLDGNGRIGRLMIALLLEHWGLLKRRSSISAFSSSVTAKSTTGASISCGWKATGRAGPISFSMASPRSPMKPSPRRANDSISSTRIALGCSVSNRHPFQLSDCSSDFRATRL
jgi:hypothetical protein